MHFAAVLVCRKNPLFMMSACTVSTRTECSRTLKSQVSTLNSQLSTLNSHRTVIFRMFSNSGFTQHSCSVIPLSQSLNSLWALLFTKIVLGGQRSRATRWTSVSAEAANWCRKIIFRKKIKLACPTPVKIFFHFLFVLVFSACSLPRYAHGNASLATPGVPFHIPQNPPHFL